ncbi:MAG TPA: hypothetical protein VFS68_04335, partial [Candidatus Udaeobacter sp.]|nr:hypothetical protein [Candidatus Udaeobacter sp.]
MFKAKQFRAKAAESAESLKHADVPNEIHKLERSEKSFVALAENEDWLAHNFDRSIRSKDVEPQDDRAGGVAETEEHILRCLGAAVIMQW